MDKKKAEKKKHSKRRWIFYVFTVILLAAAVYYFSDLKKDILRLKKINIYWLIPAVIAQLATYLFNALTYQTIFRAFRVELVPGLGKLYQASVISYFFNQTLPSAGISGNTFLLNYLIRLRATAFKSVSIILSELLIFYAALEIYILFFLVAILFFYKATAVFFAILGGGFLVYFLFGTAIVLTGRKGAIHSIFKKIQRIKLLKKIFTKYEDQIKESQETKGEISLHSFLGRKKTVLITLAYQLAIITLDGFTIYALCYGIGGSVTLFIALLALIGTKIISLIPFTPGALILYEGSLVFLLTRLGTPIHIAILVTIIYRLLSFWLPIPAGWILYRRWLVQDEKKENRK